MVKCGGIIWIFGMPGAGKSTTAGRVVETLTRMGIPAVHIDAEDARVNGWTDLGFSREDRHENGRRLSFVARTVARAGAWAVVATVSPYRAIRAFASRMADAYNLQFFSFYLVCDPKIAAARKKIEQVEMDPFEEPSEEEASLLFVIPTDNPTGSAPDREILSRVFMI